MKDVLIIERTHGRLGASIVRDYCTPLTKPWPAPVAIIPVGEAEIAMGCRELLAGWIKAHPDQAPAQIASAVPILSEGMGVMPIPSPVTVQVSDEIHIRPGRVEPGILVTVHLPDGREIEVGDGLVLMSVQRFAELIEAARFPGGATGL